MLSFTCKEQRVQEDGSIIDGEVKTFAVNKPNSLHQREGQKVYNRAFADAVASGCILRTKLEDFMRSQGVWDDAKQIELRELTQQINSAELRLRTGGFEFDEAVTLAKRVRQLRNNVRDLVATRTDLDVNTAEGQADNARFNYYISVCLVYNDTQKPVFKDMDDYLSQAATEQAAIGAAKLAQILYGLSEDFESKQVENQFLREFGLIDERNRYINSDGHLVDSSGKLINEDGHYVLPDGALCDVNGNPMNDSGDYIVERKPFVKDGKPIEPPKAKEIL